MTDRYGLFGNPVGHSKSPQIHARFARDTGQDMTYQAIEAPLGGFTEALAAFIAGGGKGCNITVPFKLDAYEAADEAAFITVNRHAAKRLERRFGELGVGYERVDMIKPVLLRLDRKLDPEDVFPWREFPWR